MGSWTSTRLPTPCRCEAQLKGHMGSLLESLIKAERAIKGMLLRAQGHACNAAVLRRAQGLQL